MRGKPPLTRRAKRRAKWVKWNEERDRKVEILRAGGCRIVSVASRAGMETAYRFFTQGKLDADLAGLLPMMLREGKTAASFARLADHGVSLEFKVKDDPEEIMLFMLKVGQ